MAARYNPPPNWPQPPEGWQPEPGWKPDPSWGPAPAGWQLWVDDAGQGYGVSPSPDISSEKNWFVHHKVLTAVLGLIVVIALANALGGGDEDDATDPVAGDTAPADTSQPETSELVSEPPPETEAPEEPPAETQPEPEAEPEPEGPGIGTPARDGQFEFTVTRVERGLTSIGEDFLVEEAQGEFVIVYVNVTNIGDEGQTLSSSGQALYDLEGRKFEPSSAYFSLPDADKFFLQSINPGNTVTDAPLLFDVPPGVELDKIELHDSIFSDGVEVSLR